ncbi:DUF2514 family protein [Pandoraea apista]|uniref:Gp23 n=1 Tax=Pandoraea apista TaxID=93218 RepID=A0A5E5P2X6_9BURK|nr:DUF2514 family protein [Pandoraea apista]OXS89538.1 hypothetical protein B7H01_19800 [Pandoraea apista]VVG70714.1 gp23 [Pandoraea apista]
MNLLDPRLWGAFLLALVLAAGGGYWKGHHDADQSATVTDQAKQIRDLTAERDTYRQRVETQAGVIKDAQKAADKATADALANAADSAGLRKQLAGYAVAARNSAAASASAPAGDPIGVLADVLIRADERAGKLARFADAAHIAGLACERSYDALTKNDNQSDQPSEKDR